VAPPGEWLTTRFAKENYCNLIEVCHFKIALTIGRSEVNSVRTRSFTERGKRVSAPDTRHVRINTQFIPSLLQASCPWCVKSYSVSSRWREQRRNKAKNTRSWHR